MRAGRGLVRTTVTGPGDVLLDGREDLIRETGDLAGASFAGLVSP